MNHTPSPSPSQGEEGKERGRGVRNKGKSARSTQQQEIRRGETWRTLFARYFPTPRRKKLARDTGIRERTFYRWVSGETIRASEHELRKVIGYLPVDARGAFIAAVQEVYPEFVDLVQPDISIHYIPSEFYSRILDAWVNTDITQRFWVISHFVCYQLVSLLRSRSEHTVLVTIARLTPPVSDRPVRSLYESMSLGQYPYPHMMEEGLFLGSDTLPGYAVERLMPATSADGRQIVFPLYQTGRLVAGTLLIEHTEPGFFSRSEDIRMLCQYYAHTLALAFSSDEFYDRARVQLQAFPDKQTQQKLLDYFRRRVFTIVKEFHLSRNQAEILARQEFEEELLQPSDEHPLID